MKGRNSGISSLCLMSVLKWFCEDVSAYSGNSFRAIRSSTNFSWAAWNVRPL